MPPQSTPESPEVASLKGEWAAILTIAVAMGAHQIAETARDALFLRELGPTRLPVVYLVLAAIGIPIALLPSRTTSSRSWISLLSFTNAAITAVFWWLTTTKWGFTYEGLYVWTGLSATVFVTFFWLYLSGRHSVSRAKVVFPRIALGGIVGALVGAMIARYLTHTTETPHLLLGSAALQVVAGLLALRLSNIGDLSEETSSNLETGEHRMPKRKKPPPSLADMVRRAMKSPYARSVAVIMLIASLTFTILDFTFKSVVAKHVDKSDLDSLFANFYVVLNLASLLSQALLARRLLLWLGLTSVMLLLPILIALGAGGVLLGGGLAAALLLKGADGSLRYSLHRTSTELLFVPMREATRAVVKPLLDIGVKPAGQALASLLIIAFLEVTYSTRVYAVITVVLAALWIVAGVRLRRLYLDVFRATLKEDSVEPHSDLPELEVGSLATLVEQMNDENDGAVCGAMDVLAAHGHAAMIPDLVLYHPSPEVVTAALRLFRNENRTRARRLAGRLVNASSPQIRVEALLFCAAVDPNFVCPSSASRDPDAMVRGVASALLLQETSELDLGDQLKRGAGPEQERFQVGFAGAISHLTDRARRCLSPEMIAATSPQVQGKIAEALARSPNERDLPLLLHFLSVRQAREHARRALVALGPRALAALVVALEGTETPLAIRYHVPRTISRFPAGEAVPILVACVATESDELVQHKALRGLGRIMATNPEVQLDRERLIEACEHMIVRSLRLLHVRSTLQNVRADASGWAGVIRSAVLELVREAERRGVEHVFRALHLLHPTEGMESLFKGITSDDVKRRASAEELLLHIVERRVRDGLLALISDRDDAERLEIASAEYEFAPLNEREALERLLQDETTLLGQAALRYLDAFKLKRDEVAPEAVTVEVSVLEVAGA